MSEFIEKSFFIQQYPPSSSYLFRNGKEISPHKEQQKAIAAKRQQKSRTEPITIRAIAQLLYDLKISKMIQLKCVKKILANPCKL